MSASRVISYLVALAAFAASLALAPARAQNNTPLSQTFVSKIGTLSLSLGPYTPPLTSGSGATAILQAWSGARSQFGNTLNNYVGFTGYGSAIDYCSAGGCDGSGPHLLTMAYIRGRSPGLNSAQNVALAMDWINDQGYLAVWGVNTTYTNTTPSIPGATSVVQNGLNVYSNSVANCTSATSGGGPSGTGTNIADGTCSWSYVGASLNSGSTTFAYSTLTKPGGGNAWGTATVFEVSPGSGDIITFADEKDCNNKNKESAPGTKYGFTCQYYAGNSSFPGFAMILGDNSGKHNVNSGAWHFGIYASNDDGDYQGAGGLNSSLFLDAFLYDGTNASYTVRGAPNRRHAAFLQDDSNSLNVLSATGTHNAGVNLSGATFTSGVAIAVPATSYVALNGAGANFLGYSGNSSCLTYGTTSSSTAYEFAACDAGDSFRVGSGLTINAGLFRLAKYTVANLPPCGSTTTGVEVVATDVTGTPTYRQTGFTGGGTLYVPVYCSGTSWELH